MSLLCLQKRFPQLVLIKTAVWKRLGALAPFAVGVALASTVAVTALAGEVDLAAAGCTELPPPDKRLSLWIVLEEDGGASECRWGTTWRDSCADAYDPRENFLCITVSGNNRPDVTLASGPLKAPVKSLTVDGIQAEPVTGYTYSVLYLEFGSGPSGDTWDVLVERDIGATTFTATLNVSKVEADIAKINSVQITYSD